MVETPIQIRFSDADMLGHVNNAQLQHMLDYGKTDYFKKVLAMNNRWVTEGFVVVNTTTDYHAEVFVEENVAVQTSVEKIGNKSITILQKMINTDTDQLKLTSRSVLVRFDIEHHVSVAVPDEFREKIKAHEKDVIC